MTAPPSRPTILVTNDDGYDAPGIGALARAMESLGRTIVVAPDREQSAASHSLTLRRPLRVDQVGEDRYRVDGTPTDCVHMAIPRLTAGTPPDLVVSGINRGRNIGDDVIYSGTVAGALEGTLMRVPSIAFSIQLDSERRADYERALPFIRELATQVLRRGLAPGVMLNVNFPATTPRGVRVTRQGTQSYRATALERHDPAGRPYYWIAEADTTPTGEPDGDHVAIAEGYISVTPLQANLTHEHSLAGLRGWELGTT